MRCSIRMETACQRSILSGGVRYVVKFLWHAVFRRASVDVHYTRSLSKWSYSSFYYTTLCHCWDLIFFIKWVLLLIRPPLLLKLHIASIDNYKDPCTYSKLFFLYKNCNYIMQL